MKSQAIYQLIIQKILIHPQRIGDILENHANYVDAQLLRIMQQKAHFMLGQGNRQAADFLGSLVTQLQEELIINQSINSQPRRLIIKQVLGSSPTLQEYQSSQVRLDNDLESSSNEIEKEIENANVYLNNGTSLAEDREYPWSKWVAILLVMGFAFLLRYYAINSKFNEPKPSEQKLSTVTEKVRFLG